MKLSVPVALLDAWTGDGRMLRSPQSGTVRHRPFPLPIRGDWTEHSGQLRVGWIDALNVRDSTLMASVTISDPMVAELLLGGLVWLELGLDSVLDSDLVVHDGNRTEFTDWRVAALTVGMSPCWDLEPATEIPEVPVSTVNDLWNRAWGLGGGLPAMTETLQALEKAVRADQREKDAAEILALVDTMYLDSSMRAGIRKAAATLREVER